MTTFLKVFAPFVVVVAILSALAIPASAATPTPAPSANGVGYCTTLLGGPKLNSYIVSRHCSTDPNAAALIPASGYTALITFFEDANYIGYYDTVYGAYGPCDSSGYGFSDLSGVEFDVNGISSYYYYNNCDAQRLYTDTYYGGTASSVLYGDRAYVGDTFNDNVWSMRVWY